MLLAGWLAALSTGCFGFADISPFYSTLLFFTSPSGTTLVCGDHRYGGAQQTIEEYSSACVRSDQGWVDTDSVALTINPGGALAALMGEASEGVLVLQAAWIDPSWGE